MKKCKQGNKSEARQTKVPGGKGLKEPVLHRKDEHSQPRKPIKQPAPSLVVSLLLSVYLQRQRAVGVAHAVPS